MRNRARALQRLMILLMFLPWAAVEAQSEKGAPQSSQRLFEETCAACHPLDRALAAHKTAAKWSATVKRMAGKTPGLISEQDAQTIAAYLAETQGVPEKEEHGDPWIVPVLGAATWLTALATAVAGLMRRRLGPHFRLHKYGAIAAACLWVLHLLAMQLS